MSKNDLRNYLLSEGFSIVAKANSGISIFDVLRVENRNFFEQISDKLTNESLLLNKIGEIDMFFENENIVLPVNFEDIVSDTFSQNNVKEMEAGAAIKHTKKILKTLKGSFKFDALFKSAVKANFSFDKTIINTFSTELLGKFVNDGKINKGATHYKDMINNDLYVIFEIAMTHNFSVEFFDSNNDLVKFNVADAKKNTTGDVTLKNKQEFDTKIVFDNTDKKAVFAFKAAHLDYKGTYYKLSSEKHKDLEDIGIPSLVMDALHIFKNDEYKTKDEFLAALKENLQESDYQQYNETFVEYSKFAKFVIHEETKLKIRSHEDFWASTDLAIEIN